KVRKYLTGRYEHRLSQKMAGRQPVNLKILPSTTSTSKDGAENYITLQEEEVRAAIGDIFTRANGRLLLVGLPGSGKTTLVLQLALHLLERPGNSMPVVLNLATWRSEFKTLDEWLSKILPTELGATPGLAEQIRKNTPLVLLLDGLDELPEADRNSCLTAIGEYGADAGRQFLISSRIAEYAATKDAPVNAQVEVAPLTVEQVEMGLAATANIQPESKRLLNALKNDPLLRQAVENPFYLNTAQLLFASGKNWSEFGFTATDVAGRQRELVDRFVESAMERKVKEEYPAEKTKHWLSFLTSRMTERNMVVFELRDLQYDWWKWSRWQLIPAGAIWGSVYILWLSVFLGIFFGILVGGIDGFFAFVFFTVLIPPFLILGMGLFSGVLSGLFKFEHKIYTRELIDLSWKRLYQEVKNSLGIALFAGLLGGYTYWTQFGWVAGILGWLLVFILTGIWYALFKIIEESKLLIQISSPNHRFQASMKALHFSILQHKFLCYQLRKQGLLPLRLVDFLHELSLRHILEYDGDPTTGKGGGAWRFRHRILQEWFA
ncbi:MAG: NACHT domain-containing protein, partial [Thermoanaerobaculia bacterium]|nr:NACHT domain-containing protein [Thermoanaerobaculia bacterium]